MYRAAVALETEANRRLSAEPVGVHDATLFRTGSDNRSSCELWLRLHELIMVEGLEH
jgi:hypothetical protein